MRRHTTSYLLSVLLGTAALLALAACDESNFRPTAIGPETQLTVVIDSAHWHSPIGEAARDNLAPYINTLPSPERAFDLRRRELSSNEVYSEIQKQKNVVFVAPLNDTTATAEFLKARFSDEAQEKIQQGSSGIVVSRPDLWRRNQRVFYITASTPEQLVETLEERSGAIRDTLNLLARQRLQREMFERNRQTDIEEQLLEDHGFAINVQHDYEVVVDTTATDNTGFVLMARVLVDTWRRFFVWYQENGDPSQLSPEWIYDTRDSLAQQYLEGSVAGYAKTDRRNIGNRNYLQTEQVNFLGRFGYETRGLWHMADDEGNEYGGGGPFLNYTFYDRESGRIYMFDGMVFAPDYDKREFLRQMEVIAHTFRTEHDVQQQQEQEQLAEE